MASFSNKRGATRFWKSLCTNLIIMYEKWQLQSVTKKKFPKIQQSKIKRNAQTKSYGSARNIDTEKNYLYP